MKLFSQFILFYFLLFYLTPNISGQCEDRSFTLRNQADVDNFRINNPNCTTIRSLTIDGSDIRDLNGLSEITTIGEDGTSNGKLIIKNTSLVNLDGLNLQNLTGNFSLLQNRFLEDISTLKNSKIGCNLGLDVSGNDVLKIIEFQDMDSTDLSMVIQENNLLEEIIVNGAISLNMTLENNPSFKNFNGFSTIEIIYNIEIFANSHMENFAGFENVKSIGVFYLVNGYQNLQTFQSMQGFNSLEHIDFFMQLVYLV